MLQTHPMSKRRVSDSVNAIFIYILLNISLSVKFASVRSTIESKRSVSNSVLDFFLKNSGIMEISTSNMLSYASHLVLNNPTPLLPVFFLPTQILQSQS